MKICIVGAGAIGGTLAARLAQGGESVSAIARGEHLAAIRRNGLTYRAPDTKFTVEIEATDDPGELGVQDVVFLTVKAPSLPALAPRLTPLIGTRTTVVAAMNGVPWWFCDALPEPLRGRRLDAVDGDGSLARHLSVPDTLGCVVHMGASVPEPGVIEHSAGNRFIVGSAQRTSSERARTLADAIARSGLDGSATGDIHNEIWMKLIGNMGMGPISVLTGATLAGMARDPDSRPIAAAMMREAVAVGDVLGLPMAMSVEERIDLGAELGEFKPSIRQDLEAGRPMEVDALVTVVSELGAIAGVPTPTVDTVLALLRGRARKAGLY